MLVSVVLVVSDFLSAVFLKSTHPIPKEVAKAQTEVATIRYTAWLTATEYASSTAGSSSGGTSARTASALLPAAMAFSGLTEGTFAVIWSTKASWNSVLAMTMKTAARKFWMKMRIELPMAISAGGRLFCMATMG